MSRPGLEPLRHNTLGLVGFLFSLLGVLTCGILGPVGLLLSMLALLRSPRGFAIAGTTIGLLSTLWLGLAGAAIVTTVDQFVPHINGELQQAQVTLAAISDASREVSMYRNLHEEWPDSSAGQKIVGQHHDAYGTPLRYTRVGNVVLVLSAGADREFATADDISLDPETMVAADGGA